METSKVLIFSTLIALGMTASFPGIERFMDVKAIKPIMAFQQGQLDRDSRIVGGDIADRNYHPYQAGIFITFPWSIGMCGGVLLSSRVVITAAHCTDHSTSSEIVLGAHFIFMNEPSQQRFIVRPENYIVHPGFDARMLYNDIVLLVLPTALTFSRYIQPINLPPPEMSEKTFEGEIATVSGWGRFTDSSNSVSDVLRFTQNEIKGNAECFDLFGDFVIDSTLCTITKTSQSGICHGDSGGPLTLRNENGEQYLVGIVSFVALAGCQLDHPTGFARVTSFQNWITYNMKRYK